MRWVRYDDDGTPAYGIVAGAVIREGSGDPFHGWVDSGGVRELAGARLLCPVAPSKIVAVGLNYRDHAAEMKKALPEEPMLFLKPPSALLEPGGVIRLPRQSAQIHYEGELAVVIGRRCRSVSASQAGNFVLGYTCAIDVTARDLQRKDVQYTRAKGFDTFAPYGPGIETEVDPADLGIATRVNGETRQSSRTDQLIFPVATLIEFISSVMTLEPGDVISTGTPSGVGELRPGDTIEVEIEGIGVLRCTAAQERRG